MLVAILGLGIWFFVSESTRNSYLRNRNIDHYEMPSRQNNSVSSSPNAKITRNSQTCIVQSQTSTVNLRVKCNRKNCDIDESTKAYEIGVGDTVKTTGIYVTSAKFGKWLEVEVDTDEGLRRLYVAETKLSCGTN